ncbi:MAG: fasciclin domain-containing protein [Saprospiraceae bacterium]|nr:fasciclin domain-containing protein [Saprospiraceae bacterium]MCB9323991.1 fasciclin domain-containing protein [Lewinellaceae bacterium]
MRKFFVFLLFCSMVITSCVKEHLETRFFSEDELTITAYLESNEEEYSMLLDLLDRANFKNAFNAYGTYTMFIYSNSALSAYLESKGYASVADMSIEEAQTLVRYHALNSVITSSSLGFGKLPVKNLEDDELVSSFDSTGLQGIIINRESRVLKRDIELSNGILHVIDRTLDPITNSIVQEMEEKGGYSIFLQAAQATGFYDVLNDIYDTLQTGEVQRKYFTVFAESDVIFKAQGINDFDQLKNLYNNGINNPSDPGDSLYQFMANHIIPEKSIFLKDFSTGNYQTFQGQLINFVVDQDFRINPQGVGDEYWYITFVENNTDFQTKNGVFHGIDHTMDIFYPQPVETIWQFNDQPVVRDLLRVNGQDGDYYTTLEGFPNMFGTVSTMFIHFPWDNYGFMLTGAKKYPNQYGDGLIFGAPDWDVTFKMPIKIVKGRYKLYIAAKGGGGRATVQMLINGVPVGEPINLNGTGVWAVQESYVAEINLTETKENDIRLVTVNSGQGQLDYLRFEPN